MMVGMEPAGGEWCVTWWEQGEGWSSVGDLWGALWLGGGGAAGKEGEPDVNRSHVELCTVFRMWEARSDFPELFRWMPS